MRRNIGRGMLAWLLVLDVGPAMDAAESLWSADYETAKARAAKSQRPMIVFQTTATGVRRMGTSTARSSSTSSSSSGRSNAVLLEVDFPKGKVLPPEQVKHNDALKTRFKIGGQPTIVVLDHDGTEFDRVRYEGGGPKAWLTNSWISIT